MTQTAVSSASIEAASHRLLTAAARNEPCAPVRDLIGRDDVAAAYAVQQRTTEARLDGTGASIVGRKIGLTSKAVQQQLGVDRPDFGMLFSDMGYVDGDTVPIDRLLQPRVEAEVAFVLKDELALGDLSLEQVCASIDFAVAALEICDSRVADWDISFADTVADNASAGLYALGTKRKTLTEFTPKDAVMHMHVTGAEDTTGTGAACLGDPLLAVQWLARQAREFGQPLRSGQVILSGALGPMRPVAAGDSVRATISGLGTISVRFSERSVVSG